MIQPNELKLDLPMTISNGVVSSTTKVWNSLFASKNGDLESMRKLVGECPELAYAQYNYTPPIHFAVREGHVELVKYLLDNGAHDPAYKIYPFKESLEIIAEDRGHEQILSLLKQYADNAAVHKYKGDNGEIHYMRTDIQKEFEKGVYKEDLPKTAQILSEHPDYASDQTYFWGEGILTFAVKMNNKPMIDLLMNHGARVPDILKWAQFYYFERYDAAKYIMEKGMNANVMSWHHVTLLHDMAQTGDVRKAQLLIDHGAQMDAIDEEYRSTPLGMAARWGHMEMVRYLLSQGADPNGGGAVWSTPLAWAKKKGHKEIEDVLRNSGAR
jgi:ankyrin repeat protein